MHRTPHYCDTFHSLQLQRDYVQSGEESIPGDKHKCERRYVLASLAINNVKMPLFKQGGGEGKIVFSYHTKLIIRERTSEDTVELGEQSTQPAGGSWLCGTRSGLVLQTLAAGAGAAADPGATATAGAACGAGIFVVMVLLIVMAVSCVSKQRRFGLMWKTSPQLPARQSGGSRSSFLPATSPPRHKEGKKELRSGARRYISCCRSNIVSVIHNNPYLP